MLEQYGGGTGTVSNKVYEAKSLIHAMDARAKQYQDFEDQMIDMRKAFQAIVDLDAAFKGKGSEAIKNFFSAQVDVANAWIDFAKVQIAFMQSVKIKAEGRNLGGNTVVHTDFLENELFIADLRAKDMVESQKEDLQKIFDDISDLVELKVFSTEDFDNEMNAAEKKRKETIEAVGMLDNELVTDYEKTMQQQQYATALYKELIKATRQGGTVSPIHFDAKAYHSSEVYQMKDEVKQRTVAYLEKKEDEAKVRELEKRAKAFRNFGPKALKTGWEFYKNALEMEWEFYNSVQEGGMEAVKNELTGIWQLISHPKESLYNISNAATHPWPTIKHIAKGIADSFDQQVIHGNTETRGKWLGYALVTIATSAVGTKGVDKVSKVAEVGVKAGGKIARDKALKTMSKVNGTMNRMPLGPQLQTVGGYREVPYNVVNPGKVKEQLLMKAVPYSFENEYGNVKTINLRNGHLKNDVHPKTGIPYDKEGFPIFDAKATEKIDESLYKASDKRQFREANLKLYEEIKVDPVLRSKFNDMQIEQIKNGDTPRGYTWHHHQEPGKLQLVDRKIHKDTGHTGGRNIWGGGSEYR